MPSYFILFIKITVCQTCFKRLRHTDTERKSFVHPETRTVINLTPHLFFCIWFFIPHPSQLTWCQAAPNLVLISDGDLRFAQPHRCRSGAFIYVIYPYNLFVYIRHFGRALETFFFYILYHLYPYLFSKPQQGRLGGFLLITPTTCPDWRHLFSLLEECQLDSYPQSCLPLALLDLLLFFSWGRYLQHSYLLSQPTRRLSVLPAATNNLSC